MPRTRPSATENPASPARTALASVALALLVVTPFAARLLFDSQEESPRLANLPGMVSEFIATGHFDRAYQLLQTLDTELLTEDERMRLAYQWAICERALGEPQKAYVHLERLTARIPQLEEYRQLWMARALEELGELRGGSLAYRDLLAAENPAVRDSARLYLADVLRRTGDLDGAVRLYDGQLRDSAPATVAELLFLIATIQEEAGNRTGARRTRRRLIEDHADHRKALDVALALRPAGADEQYSRTYVFYRHRHNNRAARGFRAFLKEFPRHERAGEAEFMLGRTYLRGGQYTRARRTFERVYDEHRRPDALYRIGGIQVRRDRDEEAIVTYERLVSRHPHHALADDALWQAAKAAERHSEFERARALYAKLASEYLHSPMRDEASWSAAFMLYCGRQFAQSLNSFRAVGGEANEPHIIDQSWFWAGKSAQHLGRAAEARSFFAQAAEQFPRSYYAARAVSMGYESSGREGTRLARGRERRSALDAVASANVAPAYGVEVDGMASLHRAHLLDQLGLRARAERELAEAAKINRDEVAALRLIRDCYEDIGSLDRALLLSTRISSRQDDDSEIRQLYPSYYWEQVLAAASEARVDPYLVLSVIRQESYFNETAVSRAGAMGLMQIMPQTGRLLARSIGVRPFQHSVLFDPAVSIRMGTRYLGDQVRSFASGGTSNVGFELGLAAYNAGPVVARDWMTRFPTDDPDAFVERIPYKETRLYVKKVLKNYTIYKTLSDA